MFSSTYSAIFSSDRSSSKLGFVHEEGPPRPDSRAPRAADLSCRAVIAPCTSRRCAAASLVALRSRVLAARVGFFGTERILPIRQLPVERARLPIRHSRTAEDRSG